MQLLFLIWRAAAVLQTQPIPLTTVVKSLAIRASNHLQMELLSTPTPLPMLSVRFYPLPHRTPVIKYVVVWNYFPFHEPKVTAVDSEVRSSFGWA
jgi:hypothetical protein